MGKPGSLQPGQNSHTGQPHRRGPDRVLRGTLKSLSPHALDDTGTIRSSGR
jgi:hypothetical protein